jgi:predicted metalloprotease
MRWTGNRPGERVEDRRRIKPVWILMGGGIGVLVLALLAIFRGAESRRFADGAPNNSQAGAPRAGRSANPTADPLKDFVSAVLGETEDVWHEIFRKLNRKYKEPRLVLFTGQVQTACGSAAASVGPFYCPSDEKVYIDLSFFQEMNDRYHAPGDFARAYVLAHEVGHHIQNLLGINEKVRSRQRGLSEQDANQLSVRLELQADFLAGAWAHHADKTRHILEPGDLEAALRAVAALGDERPGPGTQGAATAGSFKRCWNGGHGTSEQRVRWFRRGLDTGDLSQGDSIEANPL